MSCQTNNFNIGVSPELSILLIEEGFGIKDDTGNIYQRNPGLNYFSFRKWRKTDNYTIQNENRNKVYYITKSNPIIYTREQVLERLRDNATITVVPPRGHRYTSVQIKRIYAEMKRLIEVLSSFIS